MLPLCAETRAVANLEAADIDEMYRLYETYYDATERQRFTRDLDAKDLVVQLRDEHSVLRGFSTLAVIEYSFNGDPLRAIYSGDTVIHHRFWGSQALPLAWSRLAGQLKAEAPAVPLYWLLIVKGHRTYRYLSSFSRRYYPNWKHSTPADIQRMMDYLAREKFGDAYQPDRGVISYTNSRGHLRQDWARISEHLLRKPNIRFFFEKNPGFHRGDELVCLTELHADNLRSHVQREFNQALQHG